MASTHDYAGIAATTSIKTVRPFHASYEWCSGFLDGRPDSKTLASNVKVRRCQDGAIAILLYDAEIVKYYNNGKFSVDNGGFPTFTSANRITQFTPDGWVFCHADYKLCGRKGHSYDNIIVGLTHKTKLNP